MGREKKRIRVVVDSNVVFSFIIKGRSSAYMDIFSKDNLEMYGPEDILYEFGKYSEELKNKSEEFEETVGGLSGCNRKSSEYLHKIRRKRFTIHWIGSKA